MRLRLKSPKRRGRASRDRAALRELAPPRLPGRTESESRVDEGPRGSGRPNFASSLADSEGCLPDSHVWPEINTRTCDRQDSTVWSAWHPHARYDKDRTITIC